MFIDPLPTSRRSESNPLSSGRFRERSSVQSQAQKLRRTTRTPDGSEGRPTPALHVSVFVVGRQNTDLCHCVANARYDRTPCYTKNIADD